MTGSPARALRANFLVVEQCDDGNVRILTHQRVFLAVVDECFDRCEAVNLVVKAGHGQELVVGLRTGIWLYKSIIHIHCTALK